MKHNMKFLEKLDNAQSLEELAEVMNGMTAAESLNDSVQRKMAELPCFGGEEYEGEAYSWDEENILVQDFGTGEFVIESRELDMER